jgi:hypothetical protein
MDAAPARIAIKRAIIEEWRTGCYDADTAIYWLGAFRLLRTPYRGDTYELMCRAAEAEFGAVELPKRVTAPIQHGYANPDLLKALAPVREGGAA